jgi:hypothetical protein
MITPSPSSYADLQDFAFEITAGVTNALTKRLSAAGVEYPNVAACLSLAALGMHLTPEAATHLADSEDALAALEAFTPPESPEALARRDAVAEGKLVFFTPRRS